MNEIKVMLVVTTLNGGGAERVVSVWASELAELGFSVTIVLAGRVDHEYSLNSKVQVKAIASNYIEYKQFSTYKKFKNRRRILKELKPDYIISFLSQNRIWTYLCAFGTKCKRIETIRNSPWHADIPRGFLGLLTSRCFEKCYKLVLQSSDQAPYFSKKIQKKMVVIPNPISDIYETHFKTEFSEKVHTLIAVGRLSEQKNYFMLVDAFSIAYTRSKNSDICLKIFGAEDSPNYVEVLSMYIKQKGMEEYILLMGRSANIEEEYAKSDVFLMSSNFEGMPNALAEAMASRLVCISTDCKTGPRDLIDNGINGYLVPVGDALPMADMILKIVSMPKQERIDIGNRARHKIMTYCSKEKSIEKLCELLV